MSSEISFTLNGGSPSGRGVRASPTKVFCPTRSSNSQKTYPSLSICSFNPWLMKREKKTARKCSKYGAKQSLVCSLFKDPPTSARMTEEQNPRDNHTDNRQKKHPKGQVLNQALRAVRQQLSSKPPWIIRFDHSCHNLSSNRREHVSVSWLDRTLDLDVSASRHFRLNAVAQAAFMLWLVALTFNWLSAVTLGTTGKSSESSPHWFGVCVTSHSDLWPLRWNGCLLYALTHYNHVKWLCWIFQQHFWVCLIL